MSGRVHAEVKATPKSNFVPVRTRVLQHSSVSHAGPATVPPIVKEVLRSPGHPIDPATRASMESRFGHDFSQVRVHTDDKAAESARVMGARAYTVGHDVAFVDGQYAPDKSEGRKLLIHELTHMVQQFHNMAESDQLLESDAETHKECSLGSHFNNLVGQSDVARYVQLKPDRIAAITINLATSMVTISLDDGNTISGSVTNTNLLTGDYQARWDQSANGLEINPWPTREEVIHFVMSGTRPFLQRYDRLRRAITEPIPFNVVSQAHVEESLNEQSAQSTNIPGSISLTLEEAMRRCEANELPGIKVFPFRATRFGAAPIMARREGDDIIVEQPVYVLANNDFRQQTRTLPTETFTRGVRLRPNELVRVHIYEPRWYHLNITGSTEGNIEQEFCVTGEQMLDIADASSTGTLLNIGVTVVEAATFFIPVGRIATAISRPILGAGRTATAAAMISLADVAPTAMGAVSSRAAVTIVEERAATYAVGRALTRTVSHTVVQSTERGLVQTVPRAATGAVPRITSEIPARVVGTGALETGVERAGSAVRSAVTPGMPTTGHVPSLPAPVPTAGVRLTTVTGDQVIVDTNIAISLDRAAQGLPLNQAQTMMVAAARRQGIVITDRTVEELSVRGGAQATAIVTREVASTATERGAIMADIEAAGIGGGIADRQIVMQALLSETAPGVVPTFATADRGVINGLWRVSGMDPRRLGRYRTVAEFLLYERGTNTFEVVIRSRRLVVMPIQAIRGGL